MLGYEPQARGEGAAFPSRKHQEIGRIDVVHNGGWILVIGDIYAGDANRPVMIVEVEPFLKTHVQVHVIRVPQIVCYSDKLLLIVYRAERESRAIFQEIAEQKIPPRQRRPSTR